MVVDVTSIFAACFARNSGPVPGEPEKRHPPNYGVSANIDGASLDVTLTFLTGSAYCCSEWGCHLNLREGKRWDWLRRELSACELDAAETLELRLTVIVEAGALFFDWSRPDSARRCWYAFSPVAAHQYRTVIREGCTQSG
jgi:hypothetical protein